MGEKSSEVDTSKSQSWSAMCMMSLASGIVDKPSVEEDAEKLKTWPYMTFGSLGKSLFMKVATVGIIWGVGYFNWNFAWLIPPIAFVVLKGERKKDGELKRLTAQATALSKEKIIIENRIDELPTWVYFPDYDRAEWLNGVRIKDSKKYNFYMYYFLFEILNYTNLSDIIQSMA